MAADPYKYQHKDQADMDAGRPLKYHTPAINREKAKKAKSQALEKKKEVVRLKKGTDKATGVHNTRKLLD